MSTPELQSLVGEIASRGRILPDDVLRLRRILFADGLTSRPEAEALLALDMTAAETCDEWCAFICEAIADFIVHREQPAGHVSEDNADWLIRAVSRDGQVATLTGLELLIHVLDMASSAPDALVAFALTQVADAVIDGAGPLSNGRTLTPGIIEAAEVELIRRILHAFGGGAAVTRMEAEILFRINDRTVEEMNDPAWNELFVKAIASHVLAGSGHVVASRYEALRREHLFETTDLDLMGFFRRMVAGGASAIFTAGGSTGDADAAWGERNARHAAAEARAARVDEDEATWLAGLIGRDRLIHDNERALIAFIAAEASEVHPALAPLVAKVA